MAKPQISPARYFLWSPYSKWLLSRAPTVRKWFHLLTVKKLLISLQRRKVYFCFFITVQSNKKWESCVRNAESALFWHFTCLYSMFVSNWFSEARGCSRCWIMSPGVLHTIPQTRYSRCTVYPSPKHRQELRVRCERGFQEEGHKSRTKGFQRGLERRGEGPEGPPGTLGKRVARPWKGVNWKSRRRRERKPHQGETSRCIPR